jgi:hypothetical protein
MRMRERMDGEGVAILTIPLVLTAGAFAGGARPSRHREEKGKPIEGLAGERCNGIQ